MQMDEPLEHLREAATMVLRGRTHGGRVEPPADAASGGGDRSHVSGGGVTDKAGAKVLVEAEHATHLADETPGEFHLNALEACEGSAVITYKCT